MILFQRGKVPGDICVSPREDQAVQIAAANLARDVARVCGAAPRLVRDVTDQTVIVIGTRGVSDQVRHVNWAALQDGQGAPRWEGYLQQLAQGRLCLAGNDRRGTIYAIYDLCEGMGVSPWYDLGDVPVREKDEISLPDDHFKADWPCVQYRGIFLNDEEELDAWAREHTADGTIGPALYARIFELLLRLKANYIWPAMHVNAFNQNPENGRLAHRMGIVTGTSHCDMLHRNNQNEWRRWVQEKGYEGLQYDYTIPGQNRERLLEYWRESLEQNRDYDACYTIGMRGIHDSGFVTSGMDGSLSEDALLQCKRELLEEIMAAQRALIREVIPREEVPQAFVPYKEVLPIYDSGLKVPEDVTLIWVDDNHGYMRRYPSAEEQRRKGGNGLYYHSSYWAPPGMSYLFIGSIPLAHMGNELRKCYEQGIRRIWVDNVGALKPLEQETEYFLRYAWDAGRRDSAVHDPRAFTRQWMDRNFSGGHGEETADICARFAQLSNLCKPEHMRSRVFAQKGYGDEAAARVWAMHALAKRGEAIWRALPENERDAFYQLVLMKVQAAFYIAASYYYADRSLSAYEAGAMRAADEYTAKSRQMDDLKRLLLHTYNNIMSGGKWHGILTPEEFPPPPLEMYPRCRPALRLEEGRLLVDAGDWGEAERLVFDRCGRRTRWITLANTGTGALPFTIQADEGIRVSEACGVVEAEKRVMVSVAEDFTQGAVTVTSGEAQWRIGVVQEGSRPCVEAGCFLEADGYLHMPAEQAASVSGFTRVADLGRGSGAAMEAAMTASPDAPAVMRFDCFLRSEGCFTLEIIRFLTLNSTGQLRLRITVDDAWQGILASATVDEWLGSWEACVLHDGERLTMQLPYLRPGRHTLKLEALDPCITLCAVNIYTQPVLPCQLGPDVLDGCVPIPDFDLEALRGFYPVSISEVPPPRELIAGPGFWQQDMLYARNVLRPGAPAPAPSGTDRLARLMDGVVREERGRLAWEAENVLLQSDNAWMTTDAAGRGWIHRQAETAGRSGLAMCIPADAGQWADDEAAPALHYRIVCEGNALYHIWLLMKYDDACGFGCRFLMDGQNLADTAEVCRSSFHTYRTIYAWGWHQLVSVRLTAGEHVFSISAGRPGLAIDRIYMTTGLEQPPTDRDWNRLGREAEKAASSAGRNG